MDSPSPEWPVLLVDQSDTEGDLNYYIGDCDEVGQNQTKFSFY